MADALPPELVEGFRAALKRLNSGGGRIGLAVSGGPDSMAMLLLAHAAIPGAFAVATVNHGLRAEAKDECALVVAACRARGISCATLDVAVGSGNLQEQARAARYAALAQWARSNMLAAVATAHHADDQAETVLMRLNRASGVTGLAGVREAGTMADAPDIGLVRPLLHFRRADLHRAIAMAAVEVADDPSNRDDRFDRVRMRKALAEADWLDPLAIARAASHLAQAEDALVYLADRAWLENARRDGDTIRISPHTLPAITFRLVERALQDLGSRPRGGQIADLIDALQRGEGGNVAGVLVTLSGDQWLLRPEPVRKVQLP